MVNLQYRIFTSEIDIIEWDWNKFQPHLFINNCYNSCTSVSIWVSPFPKKFKVSNTRAFSLTPCTRLWAKAGVRFVFTAYNTDGALSEYFHYSLVVLWRLGTASTHQHGVMVSPCCCHYIHTIYTLSTLSTHYLSIIYCHHHQHGVMGDGVTFCCH